MQLPVCRFDLETEMLCPNCQDRLEKGEITDFDIEFSKWLLEREKDYPEIENLVLLRAMKTEDLLILLVKKKGKEILQTAEALIGEIKDTYGEFMIIEGPLKLRKLVRLFIAPAVEVGVNSLHLPEGTRESIVMLNPKDRDRIRYSKEQLRTIVSSIMNEIVLFQFQDERIESKEEETSDIIEERMKELDRTIKRRR